MTTFTIENLYEKECTIEQFLQDGKVLNMLYPEYQKYAKYLINFVVQTREYMRQGGQIAQYFNRDSPRASLGNNLFFQHYVHWVNMVQNIKSSKKRLQLLSKQFSAFMIISADADKTMRQRELFVSNCVRVRQLIAQRIHQCICVIQDSVLLATTLYDQHRHIWETITITTNEKQKIVKLVLEGEVLLDNVEIYTSKRDLAQVLTFIFILAEDNFADCEDKILDLIYRTNLRLGNKKSLKELSEDYALDQAHQPYSLFRWYLQQPEQQTDEHFIKHVNILAFFFKNVVATKYDIKALLNQREQVVRAVIDTDALCGDQVLGAFSLLRGLVNNSLYVNHTKEFIFNLTQMEDYAIQNLLEMYVSMAKFLRVNLAQVEQTFQWKAIPGLFHHLPFLQTYIDLVIVLWFKCETIPLEGAIVEGFPMADFLDQCCALTNISQLISLNQRRPDYLFHMLMSFVSSDANKQVLFLSKLTFDNLDFVQRKLVKPVFDLTMLSNIAHHMLVVDVNYNDQFNTFCDELQQKFLFGQANPSHNILYVRYYVINDDKKEYLPGIDAGGLSRHLLQSTYNTIKACPYIVEKDDYICMRDAPLTNPDHQLSQQELDQLQAASDRFIVRLAYFIAFLPLQREQLRFKLKEELIVFLSGYDEAPYEEYFSDAHHTKGLVHLNDAIKRENNDEMKEEYHDLAQEEITRIKNMFFDEGSKTLRRLKTIIAPLWQRSHLNTLHRIQSKFYDVEEICSYVDLTDKIILNIPGLQNEERNENDKEVLKAAAHEKYTELHRILQSFNDATFTKFVILACGSTHAVDKIIVVYTDSRLIPTWCTCQKAITIGTDFCQRLLELSMANAEGFQFS